MRKFHFYPNYPHTKFSERHILSTPTRISATDDYTGQGVAIAYVDAGFYAHPDIADRILCHVDATTEDIIETPEVTNITVASWHGQMVSAIAAGDGRASDGLYRGLAFDSDLVLIKVTTPELQLKEHDILRGFLWILENHERYNIRIVNVSVGGDDPSADPDHALHQAVRNMAAAGLCVVIAAGNHGMKRLLPPASAPEAIVVGGYDDMNSCDNKHWKPYHSSFGYAHDTSQKPDLIAPAQWIASPIMPETPVADEAKWLNRLLWQDAGDVLEELLADDAARELFNFDEDTRYPTEKVVRHLQDRINEHKLIHEHYQHVDGTSVAVPIVSSVIAQMLEANPSLTPDKIKMILQQTARPLRGMPPIRQGAGMVVPVRAINAAVGAW